MMMTPYLTMASTGIHARVDLPFCVCYTCRILARYSLAHIICICVHLPSRFRTVPPEIASPVSRLLPQIASPGWHAPHFLPLLLQAMRLVGEGGVLFTSYSSGTINIKFEGLWAPVTEVIVDVVGKYLYKASQLIRCNMTVCSRF